MKTTILSISAAILVTSVAVACSSPSSTGPGSSASDVTTGGNDSKPSASASASASARPTASASASASASATPSPSTSGSSAPGQDPQEAQYKQCMTQCAGTNQQAIKIFNTDMACEDKCQQDDENCFEACFNNGQCMTDQSVSAACNLLQDCDMKCAPDDQGGPGGPGGPGGQGNQQF